MNDVGYLFMQNFSCAASTYMYIMYKLVERMQ